MQQATELKKQLQSIHRKSYPAYKSLKGSYQLGIISFPSIMYREILLHLPHTSVSIFPAKMPVFRMPTAKTISHVSPLPTI